MPPPKLPLTTVVEHDPIYPYYPFVLVFSLATSVPPSSAFVHQGYLFDFLGNSQRSRVGSGMESPRAYIFRTGPLGHRSIITR